MFDFFLNYFIFIINYWWPWITFLSDIWLIQFILLYFIYLLFSTFNIYFVLFYLFIEIFLIGIFISIIQLELFTGFLWIIECTIIFISLILLFYINVEGIQIKFNLKIYRLYFVFNLFILFFIFNNFFFINIYEFYLFINFNNIDMWDNFYESIFNINMNDFKALTIIYYIINSIEFLVIGFILLIGSLICVNLNKLQKFIQIYKYNVYFFVFSYFKDYVNYVFLRKQNIINQSIFNNSIRLFKKK